MMIPYEEALGLVLSQCNALKGSEKVTLSSSLGRVLAADVRSDMNMPPFNKTAVDGYACRLADLGAELAVIEVIPAGRIPEKTLSYGQCSKIMTGAMIPQGADHVIMVEDTLEVGPNRIQFTGKEQKNNICILGEDIRTGGVALEKGTTITPGHIAILAAVGCTHPEVALNPEVAVLITGDELVEPDQLPGSSQIRNSNGHQLVAQITRAGATPMYKGIVKDTPQATETAISQALACSDIVILTGGVSMGDWDYVPGIMRKLGVTILFDRVAIQPGKPTTFGVKDGKIIFGLPGNPVSSFFQFELLVKPAINKMLGSRHPANSISRIAMSSAFRRKKTERLSVIPISITPENTAHPVKFHGSAHIFALAKAQGYIMIPVGVESIEKGDYVDVRLL